MSRAILNYFRKELIHESVLFTIPLGTAKTGNISYHTVNPPDSFINAQFLYGIEASEGYVQLIRLMKSKHQKEPVL